MDPRVALAGAFVGFVVGLTGMGGGALMTPLLVLVFGVEPLTAVSSDIVASMVMKPIGGGVHWRRGTINWGMVRWLALGSIPTAFLGVLILKKLGAGPELQLRVKLALGVALLVVSAGLAIRPLLAARRRAEDDQTDGSVTVKPLPTLLIGVLGGMVVGLTSVGSGSLMIVMLLVLYPRLRLSELVGTDLAQAVPLVTSAAIGHIFFGDFALGLTGSILVGSIPGVLLGSFFSSRASDGVLRPALMVVLTVTGLKLLGMSNDAMKVVAPAAVALGAAYAFRSRRTDPATAPTAATRSAPPEAPAPAAVQVVEAPSP